MTEASTGSWSRNHRFEAIEGHAAVHFLDGAAEAVIVPQWRQQRLRPCPSRGGGGGGHCRAHGLDVPGGRGVGVGVDVG